MVGKPAALEPVSAATRNARQRGRGPKSELPMPISLSFHSSQLSRAPSSAPARTSQRPKELSKREKMQAYAKARVPKPTTRRPIRDDTMVSKASCWLEDDDDEGRGGISKGVDGEMSELDKLESKHDAQRAEVAAIRAAFGGHDAI